MDTIRTFFKHFPAKILKMALGVFVLSGIYPGFAAGKAEEKSTQTQIQAKEFIQLGNQYMGEERYADAWNAYNQVTTINNNTSFAPMAQFAKGEVRYFSGDFAKAREEYLTVLSVYPDSEEKLRATALYSAGWSAEKLKEAALALESYSKVVEQFPNSEQAALSLLRMARVNQGQGNVVATLQNYRAVSTTFPGTRHADDALFGLGTLYRDLGNLDQAITAFTKVDRKAGQAYVDAQIEMASVYFKTERQDEGKRVLDQLLKNISSDFALKKRAQDKIAKLNLSK